jgi:FtsP/CotA-like multicopper oxidase with cupredoxin domain
VEWDYAPSGRDETMDMPFDPVARGFTETGLHQIGRIDKKAVYHEYTDSTFSKLKPRNPQDQYLGILGPIIRAEVGDTIKIVFKNNATHPFGMHPHGVLYLKDSEGADYNDGTTGADKEDACVAPGATHTYTWQAIDRSGPGPNDPSSVFWLYHSHCDELRDIAAGLFGMIVITRRGMALPDGRPKDVDHEFATMYIAINENESLYLDDNIREHTTDPKGVNKVEIGLLTATGYSTVTANTGFINTNIKWSINGYIYGNMPMMTMKVGDRVRWYVATLGDFNNGHTPHRCRFDHVRANDHRRHGPRRTRHLALPLPHQRPHARRHDGPVSGDGALKPSPILRPVLDLSPHLNPLKQISGTT